MKIRKGDYGYIRREKKKRLLVTLGLFVLPAIVFIVGLVLADGNKSNIFTVVAVVGCLPGCRAAVGFIMMVMQKPVDKAVYDAIEAKKGKLLMGYESGFRLLKRHTVSTCPVIGNRSHGCTRSTWYPCAVMYFRSLANVAESQLT